MTCGTIACLQTRRTFRAASIALLLAACGQAVDRPSGGDAANPSTPRTEPPPALQMGGAKSVTRFFVTSRGLGRGGDLGGLAAADAHCQALAKAEGSGDHTWRAYLSTSATDTSPAVNARDRIGNGPWYNALGDRIAVDLQELHGGSHTIDADHALTERGDPVGAEVHDILTGSQSDGTAFAASADLTCANWTSGAAGRAQVGHHDRSGQDGQADSWNSAHPSAGCRQQDLRATGGTGLFYCFAID
jgi:hypothetical protein